MEKFYPPNVVLLLLRTIYGLKQAAAQFWKELLEALRFMKYERNKADPCLYFKWVNNKLIVWISWVDDCLIAGPKELTIEARDKMMTLFDCDQLGEMKEYVGCKIERNWIDRWVKLTQPVMIQSFRDEFELDDHGKVPKTPAEPGSVLSKGENKNTVSKERHTFFRKGVGKMLHMMRWTRPDILNSTRECSMMMNCTMEPHITAMKRVMKYVVNTAERGLLLKPKGIWDGTRNFLFEITGMSDSNYAKDETRKSVNGWSTFLNGAPTSFKSKLMPIVALSVTEAELFSAVNCAMDMIFVMRILNCLGLKVKLPMKLEIDNKGAKDIAHNWTVGGRLRHVEVKQYFLRELKEAGIIECYWRKGDDMTSDVFTKNLPGSLFEKHIKAFVGKDKYMSCGTPEGRVSEDGKNRESRKLHHRSEVA